MDLFKLQRIGNIGYDENEAMMIVAENEAIARAMANKAAADEGRIWHIEQLVLCFKVDASVPNVVLKSFKNG